MINQVQAPVFVRSSNGGYINANSIAYAQKSNYDSQKYEVYINDGSSLGMQTEVPSSEAERLFNQIA